MKPKFSKTYADLIGQMVEFFIPSLVSAQNKPNIIVILTNKYGLADLGIQAQENAIKTPNI